VSSKPKTVEDRPAGFNLGDANSVGEAAFQIVQGVQHYGTKMQKKIKDTSSKNGIADYDQNKRKVVWEVKDVKGGKTKNLDFVLTYEKDTMLDDF
jgi:hypothetical protein